MAKTDGFYTGISLHKPGQYCHGICVIQKKAVGADLLHVSCEVLHYGYRAESTENPPDSQGVCDGLAQTVFFWNFKIGDGAGLISADLNCVDRKVGILKSRLAVLFAEICFDFCL